MTDLNRIFMFALGWVCVVAGIVFVDFQEMQVGALLLIAEAIASRPSPDTDRKE
jgi:hypothetical protein